ncbi:hypothetical protein E2F43_14975 [Seongchinamella unica]|uniref:Uncharacterized protein n=1 Tax=Seongchinamella unica TaxID=2547392 RepID=A0A4R5LQP5_9GAMM|nr:hypothetical protein E2F43_14975 [Seongchinamella unica]
MISLFLASTSLDSRVRGNDGVCYCAHFSIPANKVNCEAREGALGYKVNCAAREGALRQAGIQRLRDSVIPAQAGIQRLRVQADLPPVNTFGRKAQICPIAPQKPSTTSATFARKPMIMPVPRLDGSRMYACR